MKLTCVLIIAVLFLTAYQLTTVETYSRGKWMHRALRSTGKNPKVTRECSSPDESCTYHYNCCQLYCNKEENVCLENSPEV
nr:LeD41P [Conus litteratus]